MRHPGKLTTAVALALSITVIPAAIAAASDERRDLTLECEEALALSALPARLRDQASVYSLTDQGFKMTREKDGPFTCIVERNHVDAVIPQCVDAAGADTIIPGIMQKTQWSLNGMQVAERRAKFKELAERDEFQPASRSGISYMMSDFNYVWNANSEDLMRVPPHVMFYAPNISNEDVGGSFEEAVSNNRGTPFVVEVGVHGYMTSFVENASESDDVMAACAGQLPKVREMVSRR